MAENLLPSSLQKPHLTVFDEIYADRLAAMPVEVVLTYLVDLVGADVLPFLAKQFDVLGLNGYGLATTDAEKRAAIREAIYIHRTKGTPNSIRAALARYGYPGANFVEGVGNRIYRNGTVFRNGSVRRGGGGHWATFDVVYSVAAYTALTSFDVAKIREIANAFKPVRCQLRHVAVSLDFTDTFAPAEELTMELQFAPSESFGVFHNGQHLRDGSVARNTYAEELNVTTTP